ncbi:MAG: cytochrome P450 [Nitrospira sp.]|nr:cytochrome P450 [Nitrospira sp.]
MPDSVPSLTLVDVPGAMPLLGHLGAFKKRPLEVLLDWGRQQGDALRFRLNPKPLHLFSHPELAEEILVQQSDRFVKAYDPRRPADFEPASWSQVFQSHIHPLARLPQSRVNLLLLERPLTHLEVSHGHVDDRLSRLATSSRTRDLTELRRDGFYGNPGNGRYGAVRARGRDLVLSRDQQRDPGRSRPTAARQGDHRDHRVVR